MFRLKQKSKVRIAVALLAVVLTTFITIIWMIPQTQATPTVWENVTTGAANDFPVYATLWKAQTFNVTTAHTVTSVKLLLFRVGNPQTVTVSIRATSSGLPTGNDLTSGTLDGSTFTTNSNGAWYEFTMTEYTLSVNTQYAIVIRAPNGNSYDNSTDWKCQTSPTYSGGSYIASTDSGSSWTANTDYDFLFQVLGNAIDTTAPTYSNLSTNTTVAGASCKFNSTWTDETGLATTGGYIFGTNNTGTWTNETWTAFSSNPQTVSVTKTLNSTVGNKVQWQVWANDTNNNWNNTGTQTLTTTSANPPINLACILTNPDDTDNMYARYKNYIATVNVSDADGYADLTTIDFTIQDGTPTEVVTFRYNEDTNTFSALSGATTKWILVTGSSVAVRSGIYCNLTFVFYVRWDATQQADLDFKVVSTDSTSTTDTDTYDLNYDVITDLVTTFSINDDRGNIGQSITASGVVTYNGSSLSPVITGSGGFVAVHNSAHTNQGSDSDITNGAWSVTFNAPATVDIDTYHLYIHLIYDGDYPDGDEATTDTFITDNLVVSGKGVSSTPININTYSQYWFTLRSEYDSATIQSGTVTLNGTLSASWIPARSRWEYNTTKTTPQTQALYVASANWDTYGITSLSSQTANSTSITWEDQNPPTYSGTSVSTTTAGTSCNFNITVTDDIALSKYIFSTNNTGSWVNNTAVAFTANPQTVSVAKTLNSTVGLVIGYRWYFNDTSNNWNNTDILTLTTTNYYVSLSFAPANPLQNDVVVFTLNITKSGATFNFYANITKDGSPFKTNWNTTTFTDTEANIQSHVYSVTAVYDVDDAVQATFTVPSVTVVWSGSGGGGGGGGGGGYTGGATPTPTPSETPPPYEAPTEQPWIPGLPFNIQDVIVFITIGLVAVLIVSVVLQRKPKARKIKKFEGPNLKKIPRY